MNIDWFKRLDFYCQRHGSESLWAEPLNVLTSLFFVIAAVLLWKQMRKLPFGIVLCISLVFVGLGSVLFYMFAQVWAQVGIIPMFFFVVVLYPCVMNRSFLSLRIFPAIILTVVTAVVVGGMILLIKNILHDNTSPLMYMPFLLLYVVYAWILYCKGKRKVSMGLFIGSGVFVLALVFYSLDKPLCPQLAFGTHFLWHILNTFTLAWLMEVYRSYVLANNQKLASAN